jgi:hypothetical protein
LPLTAVSARYPGLASDEGEYIDAVTAAVGVGAASWVGLTDRFPDLDEPSLAGPGNRSYRNDSTFGDFEIATRLGARAILSGEGGDHLGGPFGVVEERARRRPLRFAFQTLARRDLTGRQRLTRARFLVRLLAPPALRRAVISRRARAGAPAWLLPRWHGLVGALTAKVAEPIATVDPRALAQAAHWRELTSARLGRALDIGQGCAAERGLEMRFPYLDQDLARFVLSLPIEHWPHPLHHPRLQREALADLLPEPVRRRTTKAAFGPVVAHNIERAGATLTALVREGAWASERWVDRRSARHLFERALAPSSMDGFALWRSVWSIATLEAWLRRALRYASARRRVDR